MLAVECQSVEHRVTDQVVCPTCHKPMQPAVRRSDYVLMHCADCRISVTVEPSACSGVDFPVACPHCAGVTGLPRRVATRGDGGVTVDVKCEACGHEWTCTLRRTDSRSAIPAARPAR